MITLKYAKFFQDYQEESYCFNNIDKLVEHVKFLPHTEAVKVIVHTPLTRYVFYFVQIIYQEINVVKILMSATEPRTFAFERDVSAPFLDPHILNVITKLYGHSDLKGDLAVITVDLWNLVTRQAVKNQYNW
jgi:hypothetical protein